VTESFTKDLEAFKFQAQPRLARIKTQMEQLNQHITTIQAQSAEDDKQIENL
jgi:hypothetical protein